ncbi:hypothetical protein niasHT_030276 [Heterodera trifolii]|uniref:Uncharacterized protein n=1 Tax=Heterodera trifolii TaxID=157864 RepID=A0ABD2JFT6_9BILA
MVSRPRGVINRRMLPQDKRNDRNTEKVASGREGDLRMDVLIWMKVMVEGAQNEETEKRTGEWILEGSDGRRIIGWTTDGERGGGVTKGCGVLSIFVRPSPHFSLMDDGKFYWVEIDGWAIKREKRSKLCKNWHIKSIGKQRNKDKEVGRGGKINLCPEGKRREFVTAAAEGFHRLWGREGCIMNEIGGMDRWLAGSALKCLMSGTALFREVPPADERAK